MSGNPYEIQKKADIASASAIEVEFKARAELELRIKELNAYLESAFPQLVDDELAVFNVAYPETRMIRGQGLICRRFYWPEENPSVSYWDYDPNEDYSIRPARSVFIPADSAYYPQRYEHTGKSIVYPIQSVSRGELFIALSFSTWGGGVCGGIVQHKAHSTLVGHRHQSCLAAMWGSPPEPIYEQIPYSEYVINVDYSQVNTKGSSCFSWNTCPSHYEALEEIRQGVQGSLLGFRPRN